MVTDLMQICFFIISSNDATCHSQSLLGEKKYNSEFFILISMNIKVLLILHTNFQPTIPSHSGENGDFISFGIFSNGCHLEFSTRLNFIILKSWSLIMLHMKFEIHGWSGLREQVI